ncbi:hypothetical protein J2T13_005359 [Paenibacillus sp. DS2015]|uniref:hypothetical protein n=1 Tax=Paenibacillus sp. DS2015 TaxID=3373917 RepID=UPI003D1DEDF7
MIDTEPKKTYYVSVAHNLIQDIPNDSTEFTVLGTDDEVSILRDKMSSLIKDDEYTFKRAFVPFKSADHDDSTNLFDDKMIELYAYIYQLGDEDTKRGIHEMNLLPKLLNTDYNDKGYDDSPFNK